jgi:capsule polysaccharide export protein KpsE/RkpR
MTSIIKNTFYRALMRIEEENADGSGFAKWTAKTLTERLVDDLYPEDGYITLEDDPRGSLRVHLDERFLTRVRGEIAKGLGLKEATEAIGFKAEVEPRQEVTVPVAAPPEVKEVKVKVVKPKLTKEQKEAEKAAKEAEKKAAKEEEKARRDRELAAPDAMVEEVTEKMAAMSVDPPPKKKAPAKPKFVGNLEKMNATHEKLWKKVAAEKKVELNDDLKKQFLAQINALDNTVYNAKKLEVHMNEFFTPKEPELKKEPIEMFPVDFKGKEYYVSADGRVWETKTLEDGSEVEVKVGNVGMLAFSEMEMPA